MSRCFLWKLLSVQVCICLQRIDAISSALDDRYRFKVVHKQNNNLYITYCFSLVNIQETSKTRKCLIIKMHSRSFLFKSGILLLVDVFFFSIELWEICLKPLMCVLQLSLPRLGPNQPDWESGSGKLWRITLKSHDQ